MSDRLDHCVSIRRSVKLMGRALEAGMRVGRGMGAIAAERINAKQQNRAKKAAALKRIYETAASRPKNLDFEVERK